MAVSIGDEYDIDSNFSVTLTGCVMTNNTANGL